ncbi:MAG: molecular chaperone TorD family protein [Acidimicrobiia bacterium]
MSRLEAVPEIIEAAGRSVVYSLLATGWALPTSVRLATIEARLLPAVTALDLPPSLTEKVRALPACVPADVEAMRDDHMALFPPIASQDAPGYETGYRGHDVFQQAALLADVAGFYRAHGLRAGGSEKERLDHITVELEFMAILGRKEVLALQGGQFDNARVCQETGALFLRDHLGCWAPSFGRRASAITASPWYRSLGTLMALWVEEDVAAAGVEPAEMVEEPLPQPPPDDGACGPCPVPVAGSS